MPNLADKFLRIDYDMSGEAVFIGKGKLSRESLIDGSHRVWRNIKTKAVVGDPAVDDIVAWIVWESFVGKPVPYIAVFKKKKV